jgi:hypothetical protein
MFSEQTVKSKMTTIIMALGIMTFSKMTLSTMMLSIMTYQNGIRTKSIVALGNGIQHNDVQQNDTQYNYALHCDPVKWHST